MKPSRRFSFLIAVLMTPLALATSHPWSDYDDTRGTWLRGTIRSSSFERPHQILELEKDGAEDGEPGPQGRIARGRPPGEGLRYPAIDVPDEGRALRIDVGGQITELW